MRRQRCRGKHPIGVIFDERKNFYRASVNFRGKTYFCGYFNIENEAFEAYKTKKEEIINIVAEEYKDKIDPRVYNALKNYKIEITD